MLNIQKIREDYVEKLKTCMDSSKSYYTYKAFENGNRDVLSNIKSCFNTKITEDNIILLVSTSVLSDGKSGAVVTTEGVYHLPWSMFGGKSVRFWSHNEVYWKIRLDKVYPDGIFALSEVFNVEELTGIMDQIAISKTSMKRMDVFSEEQIMRIVAEMIPRMMRIIQEYNIEKKKLRFYADIFDVLSEVRLPFANLSEESLLGTLNWFIQDVSKCSDSLKNVCKLRSFNTQDELYQKVLCWGIMLSLFVVDACGDRIDFSEINTIGKLFLNINQVHFPSEIVSLVENIYEEIENDEYINAITDMVNGTLELVNTWNEIGEIELYITCYHILPGIIVVLNYMQEKCLSILKKAKWEQEELQAWKYTLKNYPNQSMKVVKERITQCKMLHKAQKIFYKRKFPQSVYTVNGASEREFEFFYRMNCLMGVNYSLLDNTPLVAIAFNQYFLTGIAFCERNICWRYLNGSPEMKILEQMEYGLQSGNIFTSNIKNISYVSGIDFTMLEIKTDETNIFLPISQLSSKNAHIFCKYLIKIYNYSGLALPEEKEIKLSQGIVNNINPIYFSYYGKSYKYYITHKQIVIKKSDIFFSAISKILVLVCIAFGVRSAIKHTWIKCILWFAGGILIRNKTPVRKMWKIAIGFIVVVNLMMGIYSELKTKTIEDKMVIIDTQEKGVSEQLAEESDDTEQVLYVPVDKEKDIIDSKVDTEIEEIEVEQKDDIEWLDVYQRTTGPAVSIQIISMENDGVMFTASIGGKVDIAYLEMEECYAKKNGNKYMYIYGDYTMIIDFHEDGSIEISDNLFNSTEYLYSMSFEGRYIKSLEADFPFCEFIFFYSSDEYISSEECKGLNEIECKIARNEIYARHGRKFNDEMLQAYFDSCSWYTGSIEAEDFSADMLNDIELSNLQTIKEYEMDTYGD